MTTPSALGGIPTLIGLPWDASSSYQRGAADAPPVIRQALWSPSANTYAENGADVGAEGVVGDAGDVPLAACSAAEARTAIEAAVSRVFSDGGRPLSLGGDHSVTYPVVRAVRRHAPRLTVLHLDAHTDLYDEFEGDRFSHACPFARVMEEGLCDRLVQVGIRTLTHHQRDQAERFGVEIVEMRALREVRLTADVPVYVSVDLDVLDPAFAPGVSHLEPGGLSVRELLTILQAIEAPIVGADVVELNPRQDSTAVSAMAAAKIVRELLALMISH